MTTTLEKAFGELRTLPRDMQDELGRTLLSYVEQWNELRAGIERGTSELARGEGVEIDSADEFVSRLEAKHGRHS